MENLPDLSEIRKCLIWKNLILLLVFLAVVEEQKILEKGEENENSYDTRTMIEYNPLLLMLFAHFLADYPLQGEFLAKAKNRFDPIPGIPWWQAMTGHCGIHAGFVYLITGAWWLGLFEFIVHFLTDNSKCEGKIGYNTDQVIHIGCKFIWAFWLFNA